MVRSLACAAAALVAVCGASALGKPSLSTEAARERLEVLGLPPAPETFARAVATGHGPLIELCFLASLDIAAPTMHGRTPLLIAALRQNWPLVLRLLGLGAPAQVSDEFGVTPLMAAAASGHIETVRALLAGGARPETLDREGRTALHYAVAAAKRETMELLLPITPQVERRCNDGRDLLTMAFETEDPRLIVPVIERYPPTLQWTGNTRRALAKALFAANHEHIRLLLSKHPAAPTPEGRTTSLLAYAIVMNDAPLLNILLACGANPNAILPSPCEKEFVALLPSKYLKNYVEEDSGVTLLMLAAGLGRAPFVRSLLDAGADRNDMTVKHKMLALYFAARSDGWQCVQMLLGSGPRPEKLRVEISLSSQQATVIKDGVPIFATEISTGRAGFATPAGSFVVTDKNRHHRSSIYKVPMPYFMRLNCRDFGLHEGVVPDYPASHGCIRVPSEAARKLFGEIPVGTLVTIN